MISKIVEAASVSGIGYIESYSPVDYVTFMQLCRFDTAEWRFVGIEYVRRTRLQANVRSKRNKRNKRELARK